MRNSLNLVTRDSVLLMLKLTPAQLDQLLSALHCRIYQRETRLYIRRTAKRLITSLLEPRYGNTSMQDHLDTLEEMTFLYKCNNCGELLFFIGLGLCKNLKLACESIFLGFKPIFSQQSRIQTTGNPNRRR